MCSQVKLLAKYRNITIGTVAETVTGLGTGSYLGTGTGPEKGMIKNSFCYTFHITIEKHSLENKLVNLNFVLFYIN